MILFMETLEEKVKACFAGDHSGHDWFHTQRVVKTAMRLAQAEGADTKIVYLASLLHDVDDYKLTGKPMGDTTNAEKFLQEEGMDSDTIEAVSHIIAHLSFKGTDSEVPDTIEGKVVQDADRLDAIGAVGIARAFAYGGAHERKMYDPKEAPRLNMDASAYVQNKGTTINHFYEKLLLLKDLMNTESGKKAAIERDAYMRAFLQEFEAETEGRK
jgi:uncharacterized protein